MFRWQIRRDGEADWQPIAVPGCWEDAGLPADDGGPYWYRTALPLPATADGQRLWLRFGAVSYQCVVAVNGQEVGEHTGMWDSFEVEFPPAVTRDAVAEVLVRVENPASLTAGPDLPGAPARYPLRQTLSGFLPYVWGQAFGGLWQDVGSAVTGCRRLGDVHVRGAANGQVSLGGECSAPPQRKRSLSAAARVCPGLAGAKTVAAGRVLRL